MSQPKKKSGGKRAVEKKHRERKAARKRGGTDYKAEWLKQVDALGSAPKDPNKAHDWLARAAVMIVRATLADPGPPPEQTRRDAMKQIEQASKVMDPAKLSAELDELESALEELRTNAGHVETGKDSPPSASTDLL